MKKLFQLLPKLGVATLVLSSLFKTQHWMGAPTLLLMSAVFFSIYLVIWAAGKIKHRYFPKS